jgi:hypothetical protein
MSARAPSPGMMLIPGTSRAGSFQARSHRLVATDGQSVLHGGRRAPGTVAATGYGAA